MARHTVVLLALLLLLTGSSHAQSDPLTRLPACDFPAESRPPDIVIGAVLLNLENGRGCAENIDQVFPVASVPKLFIAGAFLQQVADERLEFTDTLTFSSHYDMGESNDCISRDMVGQEITLGYLSDSMIACSDNTATWLIMDELGHNTVQRYINQLGIADIGPVLPYSEVDRLKLALIDTAWQHVPYALASQFYRRNPDNEALRMYFDEIPRYTREELAAANEEYFAQYTYNTASPRALAEYLLQLNADLQSSDTVQAQTAQWMFNTMLLTQRQYAVQAAPGTLLAGAKNGFDYGLLAEVNILYDSLESYSPQAIVIVFLRQTDFQSRDLQRPWEANGTLNTYLRELSPYIMTHLDLPQRPTVPDPLPTPFIVFNSRAFIENCWEWYAIGGYQALDRLDACWRNLQPVDEIAQGEQLGFGLVYYDLDTEDTRFTFIYTAPDGKQYSYQQSVPAQEDAPAYWYRQMDEAGEWQIDIYRNLQLVHSQTIIVTPQQQTRP